MFDKTQRPKVQQRLGNRQLHPSPSLVNQSTPVTDCVAIHTDLETMIKPCCASRGLSGTLEATKAKQLVSSYILHNIYLQTIHSWFPKFRPLPSHPEGAYWCTSGTHYDDNSSSYSAEDAITRDACLNCLSVAQIVFDEIEVFGYQIHPSQWPCSCPYVRRKYYSWVIIHEHRHEAYQPVDAIVTTFGTSQFALCICKFCQKNLHHKALSQVDVNLRSPDWHHRSRRIGSCILLLFNELEELHESQRKNEKVTKLV